MTPRADAEIGPVGRALRDASVTMLAILATLACAMSIEPQPGIGVLAVVLCLSFSRSHLDRDLRGRLEAAIALPLVGLVAVGVGMLLLEHRWLGAAVFVSGMFASIWLRQFGPRIRRAGALIALPLVVILTTPRVVGTHAGYVPAVLVPVVVALLAVFWVAIAQAIARRLGLLPKPGHLPGFNPPGAARQGSLRPTATTRLALQMAVAIGAAFAIGFLVFPQRWAWIVLTAFIVGSGNRGRLDVAYKSVLRVTGAAAGTLAALVVSLRLGHHDGLTVALMLSAVFFGIWLRPLGYAWWALFVTLALALLQGFEGISAQAMLTLRLQEILIGAILGVASAWCVYPVRSTDVLRRRIGDVLETLSDAFDPNTPEASPGVLEGAFTRLGDVAPSFRALRWATKRVEARQPADWIDATMACRQPALALVARQQASPAVRKAIGVARRALREPAALPGALQALAETLQAAWPTLEAQNEQVE